MVEVRDCGSLEGGEREEKEEEEKRKGRERESTLGKRKVEEDDGETKNER